MSFRNQTPPDEPFTGSENAILAAIVMIVTMGVYVWGSSSAAFSFFLGAAVSVSLKRLWDRHQRQRWMKQLYGNMQCPGW